MERVDADDGLGGVPGCGDGLGERGSHVHADRLQCSGFFASEVVEECVQGGGVLALGSPDDLACRMVGDQGEVAVALAPAHLVDADAHEAFQPAGVQSVGDDSFAGTPDGVPVDAQDPGDGGLVGLRREVGHEVLKVAGESGPVSGERHLLTRTPCAGQLSLLRLARMTSFHLPMSRCRHDDGAGRVS